jgi:hypothetical protein
MAAYTCAESLRYVWLDEEGDGEGGYHYSTCCHEDRYEEEVGFFYITSGSGAGGSV